MSKRKNCTIQAAQHQTRCSEGEGRASGNPMVPSIAPSWGPLVEVCARYGIKRTRAFEFAKEGLVEHFALGRSRMVYIESVERLADLAHSKKCGGGK